MSILTRYVLGETTRVLLTTTTVITLVILPLGVGREALDHGLPLGCTLQLLPYLLPEALRVGLPVAVLLAVVMTFSRLSGFNELLAVKAAGVPPHSVIGPVLALAFTVSLFTVWMNDLAASWGRDGVQRVVIGAAEQIVLSMLHTRHAFQQDRVALQVREIKGRRLIEPLLVLQGSDSQPGVVITAEEAELLGDPLQGTLRLRLRKGTLEMPDKVRVQFPDEYEQELPLSIKKEGPGWKSPSRLALREIPREIAVTRAQLAACWEEIARLQAGSANRENPPASQGRALWEQLQAWQNQLHRLQTEPYRRWAAGFSCLGFALVGTGMAIRLHQREALTAFFLCFAPILIVYYPLLAWTVDAAKTGQIPPLGVWSGNVLLAAWGGWLLWWESNH